MVALSFKRRFVAPIQAGLGILPMFEHRGEMVPCEFVIDDGTTEARPFDSERDLDPPIHPKRQTIRAGTVNGLGWARSPKGRILAKIGGELQLYCGMRTKGCFLIGRARCTTVMPIYLNLDQPYINVGGVRAKDPEHFARRDGFASLADMAAFWRETHGGVIFSGTIIFWEPII